MVGLKLDTNSAGDFGLEDRVRVGVELRTWET